jgi:hypothetical protein
MKVKILFVKKHSPGLPWGKGDGDGRVPHVCPNYNTCCRDWNTGEKVLEYLSVIDTRVASTPSPLPSPLDTTFPHSLHLVYQKEFIAVVVGNNQNQYVSRVCVLLQGNGSVTECVDQTPITVTLGNGGGSTVDETVMTRRSPIPYYFIRQVDSKIVHQVRRI